MKVFKVRVNSQYYEVEVEELKTGSQGVLTPHTKPAPVTANIQRIDSHIKKNIGGLFYIKAPLPGVIVEVIAKDEMSVKCGDKVLILEAMKMENAILSPVNGTVEKINVKVGESVTNGQEMITLLLTT